MKKEFYKSLTVVTIASSVLTGCSLIGDLEYTLDKDPVEMHGDSVRVSISVVVPEKGLNKKASAEIVPMLGSKAFKPLSIQGEKATGNGQTIMFKPGETVTYTDVIAYSPDLENADLKITGKASKGSKEIILDEKKIGDGTVITPLLVQNDDRAIMAKDDFVRTTEQVYSGTEINFDKAKSNVKSSELKQEDIVNFKNWMIAANSNPKVAPKAVNLIAYASPEGETGKNNTLANDRGVSTKEALVKLMAKTEVDLNAMLQLMPKGEDWDGFKAAMEASDIEDKDLIVRVLQMYPDPVKREEEIKKMSATYKRLEKDILPPLRRTQIKVNYDQIGWSDEELKSLSLSNPDTLTVEELLFTAGLYDDMDEKARLYKEAVRQYPNEWRAHNNLGYVYYNQNDMAKAKASFEKANSLKESAITLNNLGLVARQEGDREKATELFNSAMSAGSDVKYNMGIIDIQNGDYSSAISNMGSANTFNKALAQVLNEDYSNALSTIDASSDANSAMGYYLKAIIGARQNNVDMLVNNLTSAISKDSAMKNKASKDREFFKFYENASFQNLVK
ncbi:MAG: tetratricopeptide repeat protein [Putridiphycobacter sp.]|nr:tetratricopeptide repeat protein [Putridiphycobacter sp.]